jgi:hypothetical protein
VQEKYTIFDNFDKLDLNPVADKIVGEDAAPANFIESQNNKLAPEVEDFAYGSYNETNLKFVNSRPSPLAFSEDMNSYVPDMYRFLTNKRFYLQDNGNITHTLANNVKPIFGGINQQPEFAYGSFNAFRENFFFDLYTTNFMGMIFNNFLIYKNKFTDSKDSQGGGSFEFFNPYFREGVDTFKVLNKKSVFSNPDSPYLGGMNRVVFDNFDNPYPSFLETSDLYPFQSGPLITYLDSLEPESLDEIALVLQRLLYPYKTPDFEIPKHIYLVSDLKKSHKDKRVIIKPHYGTYKEFAEEFPENVKLEWQLPNIYAYYSYIKSNSSTTKGYYKDVVRLNSSEQELKNFNLQKYYEISNDSKSYLNSRDVEGYLNLLRQKNIIFGKHIHEVGEAVLSIDEVTKDFIPYYNKITLPSQPSPFMNLLKNKKLYLVPSMMSFIGNYFEGFTAKTSQKPVHTFTIHNHDNQAEKETKLSAATLQVFDIGYGVENSPSETQRWQQFMSSKQNIKLAMDTQWLMDEAFESQIWTSLLKQQIVDYSGLHSLSFNEFNKGKKCYSEILAYEVVKYGFDPETGEKSKLQSFFVPSLGKSVDLLDTQIFYGKEYIYEVFTISLVVGLEYTSELRLDLPPHNELYKDKDECVVYHVNQGDDNEVAIQKCDDEFKNEKMNVSGFKTQEGGNWFWLNKQDQERKNLNTMPKPLLVRAPFYNTLSLLNDAENPEDQERVTLIDNPPLPPEISFNQYKDVVNKVLISLNVNYGEQKLTPIKVFEEDEATILKYRQNQKELNIYPRVLYQTDDFKGTYKVYRTTIKPKDWSAFDDAEITEIDNVQTSAFEDMIFPNVDYYYFARFVDIHGNISNPTSIFHLNMVQDGGFPPFMVLKTYSFSEAKSPLVYDRGFKKYLKISLKDEVRSFYNVNDVNKIDFGYKKVGSNVTAPELKKYKVRITSKKTGKKIDINLDFRKRLSTQFVAPIPGGLSQEDLPLSKAESVENNNYTEEKIKSTAKDEAPPQPEGTPSLPTPGPGVGIPG